MIQPSVSYFDVVQDHPIKYHVITMSLRHSVSSEKSVACLLALV